MPEKEEARIDHWTNDVHEGDCTLVMPDIPDESVHAIVGDSPYGLAFMGRSWDQFKPREYQAFCKDWAMAAKRVLKPGGHLLAFSGNRTHHRAMVGIEDAGYEIRDTLTYHYGSGFPKALDVSKAIDKTAGAQREVVETKNIPGRGDMLPSENGWNDHSLSDEYEITAPATDAAKQWDGWKTTLKPATEFVVLARKPLSEGTVAANVQEHGTGALNIDGCRIEMEESLEGGATLDTERQSDYAHATGMFEEGSNGDVEEADARYPANVVFDEWMAERLDNEVGELETGELTPEVANNADSDPAENCYGEYNGRELEQTYEASSGGPSRYFYTSKATKAERTLDGQIENTHPTVKPQDLMEWLVKLVTAEGQIVLDPFAGSGTTLMAAKELGRRWIGIEQKAKWCDVARARVGLTPEDPSHIRPDDEQQGLEAFGGDE